MDDNLSDRMASTNKRGRGRPPKAEVESRPPPVPADPVPMPLGRPCPACGRAMIPKILRSVSPELKYCSCTLCGKGFKMYLAGGRWLAQVL